MIGAAAPAGILCPFPEPSQNNLGYLFFIEFFVDSFIVSSLHHPSAVNIGY